MTSTVQYESDDVDELLDLARANAQAVVIATTAFFDLAQASTSDWTRFLGEVFASSWDTDAELHAGEFLEAMLTNYQSFGARIIESALDAQSASALIHGFPSEELCLELNCDCRLADAYFDVPFPLAERFNLAWSWSREDDFVRMAVSPISDGA